MVSCARFSQSTPSTASVSAPAEARATRQLDARVIETIIAGASAQPRLPVMPWTLNAWPSRFGWILRLSRV